MVGLSFALAGLQRWASILAGAAILLGLIATSRRVFSAPVAAAVGRVKTGLGQLLKRRKVSSLYLFGMLNGLLPCGLVYAAGAGAVATGGALSGVGYMAAFALGTVPLTHRLANAPFGWRIRLELKALERVENVFQALRSWRLDEVGAGAQRIRFLTILIF
jgi:uncharacterized protein